jgi:hypothetical protein
VLDGLTHQNPVKWIAMQWGQLVEMKGRGFIDWKTFNCVFFTLIGHEKLWWFWQREFLEGVFNGDFPCGGRA